ncbi:MAG: DNA-directed RNA polymerase subunit omega [Clostridia bacterium]|nr:DNA-directed RNA polymerase subunit omega [Clostridia bacterium]
MLIEPPIDKLVEQVGCKYALVCLVTKRARELQQKTGEDKALPEGTNPVSHAAKEVYEGNVEAVYEN